MYLVGISHFPSIALFATSQMFFYSPQWSNFLGPQAPGSQFGAPLPPVRSTHLSPSRAPPLTLRDGPQQAVPLVPQNQSSGRSPISTHQDQRHLRSAMQQYPTSRCPRQQQLAPNRQAKPREYPWTSGRRPQFGHSLQRNNPDQHSNIRPPPHSPPSIPARSLDQFPPLGTERLNVPPKPPPPKSPQANIQGQTQHRTQYQPFPLQGRPPPERKPAFRNPQVPSQAGKSRMSPPNFEQAIHKQNTNLQVFAREIIAAAAPTPEELAAQNQHLKRCRAICRKICPEGELVPFGSLVSKCYILHSSQLFLDYVPCSQLG